MGSISKAGARWRAFASKNNKRKSKVCLSRTEAKDWISQTESDMAANVKTISASKTFGDALERYLKEVSVHKKGWRYEKVVINRYRREPIFLKLLADVTPSVIAKWRDTRRTEVKDGTVLREWNLFSNVFTVAIKEWEWVDKNPMQNVRRPKQPKARDRLISQDETDLILHTTNFNACPNTKMSRVGAAFLFAIETGMRASEIASVKPGTTNLNACTCHLAETKNGSARDVPLSGKAVELLKLVGCDFMLTASQISSLFAKARNMAGIDDLHFHDTRHAAITNLSSKLEVLELARMVGIRDLKILLVYYNQTASEIAKKL